MDLNIPNLFPQWSIEKNWENTKPLMKIAGLNDDNIKAIKDYLFLIPNDFGVVAIQKEELFQVLQQQDEAKEQINRSLDKSSKQIKKIIQDLIKQIDHSFRVIELTYKETVINEQNQEKPPIITQENRIYSDEEIPDIIKKITEEHKEWIKKDLEFNNINIPEHFDILFTTTLEILLKNITIDNAYDIITEKKDVIFDDMMQNIQRIYNKEFKQILIDKVILEIKEKNNFDIDEVFMNELKEYFPKSKKIHKPTNSFIRKTLKEFHDNFAEYFFSSQEFLKIDALFKGKKYIKKHDNLKAFFGLLFIASYIFDKNKMKEFFSYYLQRTVFNNAHTSHTIETTKKKNKIKNQQYTSTFINRESEDSKKRTMQEKYKTFFEQFIDKNNNDIRPTIKRIIKNKWKLDLFVLNQKYSLWLTEPQIQKYIKEAPDNILREQKISTKNKENNKDDKKNNKDDKENVSDNQKSTQQLIQKHQEDPSLFTSDSCIAIFQLLGYKFINEKSFIKNFNDILEKNNGKTRKIQLIKKLHDMIIHGQGLRIPKPYRKVDTIELNHGIYRLVKKWNTIMGIYDHKTYERNVYLRLK